jgi:putative ABC transport system substrate-binding protein
VVFNPESATEVKSFLEWEAAARTLNMEAQRVEIRLQGDIDRVISEVPRQRLDALTVAASTMFVANRKQILTAVAKTRLPAIYGSAEDTDAGGLMSYGPNVPDGFRRAAGYVAKILKGAKPADLPFEQPTRFQLTVNLKTAKEIGIAFPQSILLRADQVIETE